MPLRFSPPGGASALALKSLVRGAPGVDGDDGSLLFEQNSAPATDKPANSLWIDSDSTDLDVYQLVSSVWTDTGINLKGTPGTAATIAAGTTTTAAEGSSAAVANSGSSSAAVFDFTIPRGAAPAVGYTFSTTTTDSDPGNGIVRFNNATPASITTIYFDNQDADGNTVTAWLDTFDDSTDTSSKGFLTFTDVASPSTKIGFNVTGSSVVDGTGYRKVTVTHSFGTTLFTDAHRLSVTFSRTGNKGTDGAGTGDVSGPSSSVDSEIALFNSTTGKLIKRASTTGIAKLTSGVLSAAASGTDYAPATSGSAILKGNGSGGFSSASAGTDYVAPSGALGTPSSGTLTNCSGLPASGLVASTSQAVGFGSVEMGHASDTTLGRYAAGILGVEGVALYPNIPLTSKSAAYTTVLADANTGLLHPSADTTARTWTIDSNANVAYPVGTVLTFVNQASAGTLTISITSDTMRLAGAGTTGSRTLAANGVATALKVTSTEWLINGTGLT